MEVDNMRAGNKTCPFKDFDAALREVSLFPLRAYAVDTIQINVGKLCNQSCAHCHVEAGPNRTEIMTRETMQLCLDVITSCGIVTVELTGGAPEMNPHFRWLVERCRETGCHLVVRSNATAMLEPGLTDIPTFCRDHGVEIIASLPCYTLENVDAQRGSGVFNKSIKVLKALNELGYAAEGSDLVLNLIYNPGGAFLPGDQDALERDYGQHLGDEHGIRFNHLYTITNMPIGRFKKHLDANNEYDDYMNLLIGSFNPDAAKQVMCRHLISIGWDGSIYDCDFNQVLNMMVNHGAPAHLEDFDCGLIGRRRIVTGLHCYGCTAGAGSSCSGALD
jgi:radical SAM/Cys-rich protein